MVQNQEFVNQLTDKISKLPKQLHTQMKDISDTHNKISEQCINTAKFLQHKVLARMCPSELYKTDVERDIKERSSERNCKIKGTKNYEPAPYKEVITFNHKGIGAIEVPVDQDKYDSASYGTTFSRPLKGSKIFEIIRNPVTMMGTLQDFAKNNKAKAMPIWVEMMQIQKEAKVISTIGDRHTMRIIDMKIKNPIDVVYAEIVTDKENIPIVTTENLKVHTIGFSCSGDGMIYLRHGKKEEYLSLHLTEIRDYLVLNQIGNELNSTYEELMIELRNEAAVLEVAVNAINDRFAAYSVMSEISGNKDDDYQYFSW